MVDLDLAGVSQQAAQNFALLPKVFAPARIVRYETYRKEPPQLLQAHRKEFIAHLAPECWVKFE